MVWLNLSILIATTGQWLVYRDIVSAAEAFAGHDELYDNGYGSADNDRSDVRYFQKQIDNIMTVSSIGRPTVEHTLGAVPTVTTSRSRLSAGFFKQHRPNAIDKKHAERRRFTHRPKDVTVGRGAGGSKNVTSNDYIDDGGPKTTKSTAAARILFGTENECVSTNPGRACVCYMTDFLDLICQRLDEAAVSGDDDEDETAALRCRSFKPVPEAFVIYPGTAAGGDVTSTDTADAAVVPTHDSADVMVERNDGKRGGRGRGGVGDKKAVAPTGKEIDFDKVVSYQLEKSSDGKQQTQT
ncbi:unnamed protein product [Macrosiphum euphorbiae]|uniref:Uncharacterized protein n=1 Tax=Macrosiphum euphorbiae TaxID=13131 RepID=A0AAV0X5P8_9HEMI|nr:unnamed protein product [Macrosiphum euphorbiae]